MTHADNGIVIQWKDCKTAYVRGSKNKLDELVVHYLVCFGGGGPCPDGNKAVVEADPPLTIDDRHLTFDPPDYHLAVIEYRGDGIDGFASLPDEFDCSF